MNELEKYLELSQMMTLATLDESGNPYTANVYFAYDEEACYFISRATREHSQHIEKNNSIAWSIINTEKYSSNDSDKKWLQFQWKCILLEEEEWRKIFEEIYNPRIWFKNWFPEWHRVYKCIPKRLKIWDESLYWGNGKVILF